MILAFLLEYKAFGKRRFSQETADSRKEPQKGTRRKPQIGVRPFRFVPLSAALTYTHPTTDQRTPWGGGGKRGGGKPHEWHPSQKGVLDPSYGTFSTPLTCQCSVFPVQKSTTEQTTEALLDPKDPSVLKIVRRSNPYYFATAVVFQYPYRFRKTSTSEPSP